MPALSPPEVRTAILRFILDIIDGGGWNERNGATASARRGERVIKEGELNADQMDRRGFPKKRVLVHDHVLVSLLHRKPRRRRNNC